MRLQISHFKKFSFLILLQTTHKLHTINFLIVHPSSFGGEKYIQQLITTHYPCHCQEVFRIPLETFLALEKWLTKYTTLTKARKYFLVQ